MAYFLRQLLANADHRHLARRLVALVERVLPPSSLLAKLSHDPLPFFLEFIRPVQRQILVMWVKTHSPIQLNCRKLRLFAFGTVILNGATQSVAIPIALHRVGHSMPPYPSRRQRFANADGERVLSQ
jgi:hypothetical protein